MEMLRSALCTGRLYRPENIPGTRICYRLNETQDHSAAGRIVSMNANSIDNIGNRIRDLPACSAVPEPTAPPRTSPEYSTVMKYPQTGGCYSIFKVNHGLAKIITNKLTPWSKVLFEKLTGPQLVKNFQSFYGTRMSIAAHKIIRHLSVSSARSIPPVPSHSAS